MTLQEIKKKIDTIDFQILKLINARMELGLKSKKIGTEAEAFFETNVINKIRTQSGALIDPQFSEKLFNDIVAENKKLRAMNYQLIGFQGEHGAYSEVAARRWQENFVPIPCNEFLEVFDGVNSGLFDFGIVPVGNTLGGVVSQVNQLILKTNLYVVGAVELPIHHCLLALPGTNHRELRVVYSHYQALGQCHHFIIRNKLEPIPYYDTAGAARMLSEKALKGTAVIASNLCAELYDLIIIKENIEDFDRNITRFLIIAKNESEKNGSKCSILFSTAHKAGTLFRVLEVFAKQNINLTRIESIPDQKGSYAFFLDFVGAKNETKVQKVLEAVRPLTNDFKILGFYEEI
jgi:prephenate dehydratase/chorismate mutase/prephenate dehydratase